MKTIVLGIVVLAAVCWFAGDWISQFLAGPDFTEAQIAEIKIEIRNHYQDSNQSQHLTVDDVEMVKDTKRHLTGYVNWHKPGAFGLGQTNGTANCTATMDEDSGKSFFQCK